MEFLVFGEDWQRHPSSTQHLFALFNQQHPVYWINSIGLRQPSLSSQDIFRVVEKIKAFSPFSETDKKTSAPLIKTIAPLVWPLPQNKLIKKSTSNCLNTSCLSSKNFVLFGAAYPVP